ncbi:hypothetical protein C9439_01260 [archaeon SCG-AAA382B04]|nr:hypothetical protein C9439_01260 [archaeon SCG-AAA382B04]
MSDLSDLVNEVDDLIRPFGEIDLLLLYGVISRYLKNFLGGREIATRVWLSSGNIPYFLRRGTNQDALFIDEFIENVDRDFLFKRKEFEDLDSARSELNKKQELIWQYFVPNKLINFFYATNKEKNDSIDRAYLDIDRGDGVSADEARKLTYELSKLVNSSEDFMQDVKETFVFWTGNSFHYYFYFKEEKKMSFYNKKLRVSEHKPRTLVETWVEQLNEKLSEVDVVGGHERVDGKINIDPSQTPPGKLGRPPLGSVHLEGAEKIDGFSIPIEEEMLSKKDLIEELTSYSARKIALESEELGGRIPDVQ